MATVNGEKPAVPPNQTLYVSNLNVKVQKEDLRRALYCLFSTYGAVLDVVARKTPEKRGFAHIVYRDSQISTQAMRNLQGVEILGKEMHIEYAKGRSNVISRLDGTILSLEPIVPPSAALNETQMSIFQNPNMVLPDRPDAASATNNADGDVPHGVKRVREDESDEEGAPMEEDSGGEAMEESDDD